MSDHYSLDTVCPVCERIFGTIKGLNSHLKTALLCRHWGKGKRKEISDTLSSQLPTFPPPNNHPGPSDMEMDIDGQHDLLDTEDNIQEVLDIWDDEEGHPYHFVEEYEDREVGIGEAGPGPSTTRQQKQIDPRILDEENDELFTDWNLKAGIVVRMDQRLHSQWKKLFLQDLNDNMATSSDSIPGTNQYAPFASELDWRIAKWVVKDKIGHKSFDRFLAIPGVFVFLLFTIL